jgi:uncharacterized protein (TIGR03118 family)
MYNPYSNCSSCPSDFPNEPPIMRQQDIVEPYPYSYDEDYPMGGNRMNKRSRRDRNERDCNRRNQGILQELIPNTGNIKITTWDYEGLVSNIVNKGANVDPTCVNPWGMAMYNNELIVCMNMTDFICTYSLSGANSIVPKVSIRNPQHNTSYATGIAVNCSGGFQITLNNQTRSAKFLIATEHGTILGYNPALDQNNVAIFQNSQIGENKIVTVYKGICIVDDFCYCADFYGGKIDVFDSNGNKRIDFKFVDNNLEDPIPADYGPNNIVNIEGLLFVAYARKDVYVNIHHNDGLGSGYVSIFDTRGIFLRRFTSRGVLNAPWAMIKGPDNLCGIPNNSILIGNTGNGLINIFDRNGKYQGQLISSANGQPIVIDRLWDLKPYYTSEITRIYYTSAGVDEKTQGVIGVLTASKLMSLPSRNEGFLYN